MVEVIRKKIWWLVDSYQLPVERMIWDKNNKIIPTLKLKSDFECNGSNFEQILAKFENDFEFYQRCWIEDFELQYNIDYVSNIWTNNVLVGGRWIEDFELQYNKPVYGPQKQP